MADRLTAHLSQISTCAQSIAELPFPGRRGFTNAILINHDITALIRDTESHERALFHLAPPQIPTNVTSSSHGVAPISSAALKARRQTMHPTRQPRSKAVAAVLGGDMYARIQASNRPADVDVDLLLQGAEKLATVYPIAGALDKISQLKRRHQQLHANITHYEDRVAQQTIELEKMRSSTKPAEEEDTSVHVPAVAPSSIETDWESMQDEIRELERKKKSLEDRVTGMEKDLGGLLR